MKCGAIVAVLPGSAKMMRVDVIHIPLIEHAGFDSAELDICEIAAMNGGEFARLCSQIETSRLTFPVFSGLIPLTVRFHSADFDREYWLAHVRASAERVSRHGTATPWFSESTTAPSGMHCRRRITNWLSKSSGEPMS